MPMQARQARHIAISEVLTSYGYKPASIRKGGRERWYRSPIRSGDSNPSFKVDTQLNLWYDHGLSQGGDVIDLVCQLKSVSVSEALHMLGNSWSTWNGDAPAASFAGEKEKNHSASIIVSVEPLKHPALIQYLEGRFIDVELARRYVKEVHYRPASGVGQFFGIGFPSGSGFDIRSARFKGFVGSGKAGTIIKGSEPGTDSVCVFEGFPDFLTLLTMRGTLQLEEDAMLLFSTSLKRRAVDHIDAHGYKTVNLYLDHDTAGRQTTTFMQSELSVANVFDKSDEYQGHNDLNAWWSSRAV